MSKKIVLVLIVVSICLVSLIQTGGRTSAADPELPNLVFIIGEDLGPELGCYGDKLARTPNIDRLAREGALFTRAFTHAPVCAPSRSGLITGQYPTTIGSHHMRSTLLKPPPLFTGDRSITFPKGWDGEARVLVVQSQALPLTVAAIAPHLTTNG